MLAQGIEFFMEKSLFDHATEQEKEAENGANAPQEITVSQLSNLLKRRIEDEFGYVRVRGELSRVTVAKSGHLYTSLKDENAVLDSICWKGTLSRLSVRPEEGLDVVCTGRLTTYPARSNYQLIIESMELAGEGALLKMLEERRKKLAAEGLFDDSRKKALPFLPEVIGVVTSPSGAVIRDILHRLAERFPRRVLVWPVMVQGQGAAEQVKKAIEGFNALPEDSPCRPDVLIVARGGGALEDLMPFNDEAVVRAAAASTIPLISAVGHETDTTLIDYAADLRAPTPTAAAEKAVPVRTQIAAQLLDYEGRLVQVMQNRLMLSRRQLEALARGLGNPARLLENAVQRLDQAGLRLDMGLKNWLAQRQAQLRELAARLTPSALRTQVAHDGRQLQNLAERLHRAARQKTDAEEKRLAHAAALLESLSFKKILARGFVLVTDENTGKTVKSAAELSGGDSACLQFHDGKLSAIIKTE